jgi:hypothetical protein
MAKFTKENILHIISTKEGALERAFLAIYDRQTHQEQSASTTLNRNDIGFNAADASSGSYFARWAKQGRRLSGKHREKGMKIIRKYAGQLADIANEKAMIKDHALQS